MPPVSNNPPGLVLASGSPRRREILERLGLSFQVRSADVEELFEVRSTPEDLVLANADLKCRAIAAIFPDEVVLAADTAVFLGNRVLNKPADREEAAFMLGQLSGRKHVVWTGLRLIHRSSGREWREAVRSEVTFRPLDWLTVRTYFERVDPLDKAGAYGIQEHGELLGAACQGSFTNVMGLPMEATSRALAEFGIQTRNREME
jgi:septum formation protein